MTRKYQKKCSKCNTNYHNTKFRNSSNICNFCVKAGEKAVSYRDKKIAQLKEAAKIERAIRYYYTVRTTNGIIVEGPYHRTKVNIARNACINRCIKDGTLADVEFKWLEQKIKHKNGEYDSLS